MNDHAKFNIISHYHLHNTATVGLRHRLQFPTQPAPACTPACHCRFMQQYTNYSDKMNLVVPGNKLIVVLATLLTTRLSVIRSGGQWSRGSAKFTVQSAPRRRRCFARLFFVLAATPATVTTASSRLLANASPCFLGDGEFDIFHSAIADRNARLGTSLFESMCSFVIGSVLCV